MKGGRSNAVEQTGILEIIKHEKTVGESISDIGCIVREGKEGVPLIVVADIFKDIISNTYVNGRLFAVKTKPEVDDISIFVVVVVYNKVGTNK